MILYDRENAGKNRFGRRVSCDDTMRKAGIQTREFGFTSLRFYPEKVSLRLQQKSADLN